MVPRPLPTAGMPLPRPAAVVDDLMGEQSAIASTGAAKRASFRNQDPEARAQRLARALVSDIVAYNKDKLKLAAAPVTLRTEFKDEIRKSWEEYVEQVGLEMAKKTPYFRDALNEILAKGERIF
jgi:hypothetical protein